MQLDKFYHYFIPKGSVTDVREQRKLKLLVSISFVSSMYALFYFPLVIIEEYYLAVPIILFFTLGTATLPFLLKNKVGVTLLANLYIVILGLSEMGIMAVSGGVHHTATDPQLLVLMPIIALLFINRRAAIIWLIIGIAIISTIGILQMNGIEFIPQMNPHYLHFQGLLATSGHLILVFMVINIFENLKNEALDGLTEKNQELQWEKALVEQERLRAEESEKFKQQFLANMTHEIRTPMNAIIGLSNIVLNKKLSPEELNNYLKIIQLSSNNLQNIINDILYISKIEAGRIELEQMSFSLKTVAESVYQTFINPAAEKEIQLTLDYDDSIPSVLVGDPTKLNQILSNIVSNAIKFTLKGSVNIKIRKDREKILFAVTDTGIGMTKEHMDVIFEPFRQADASTTRKYGGTGLGLYISKQFLVLHKSDLIVYSVLGKGSTFSFSIEYSSNPIDAVYTKPFIISDEMIQKMSGLKILLAEDNEFNRIVAAETLELKIPGVKIDFAYNGNEAVEKLSGHDIALMDVHMPELDGYEATKKIRSELPAPFNSIPIIALTASIIDSDYNKCFKSGMDAIVPKPFNPNDLLLTIYNAVFDKKSLQTNKASELPEQNGHITNVEALKIFCNNNEERVKTYIRLYLDYTPENLGKLKKYFAEKNFKNMKMTAHTLKTHLKYMGMKSTARLAEDFEEICSNGRDLAALEKIMGSIEKMCETSYAELKDLV
jgi:signal transduction histidine kinase/CheY-like chemotaxis protein/HPt (histidine-containing phosphotransfer) domain-containing protein